MKAARTQRGEAVEARGAARGAVVMLAWDLAHSGLSLVMIITYGSRSQEGEKGGAGVDTVYHGRREGASTGKGEGLSPHKSGTDSRAKGKELNRRCPKR